MTLFESIFPQYIESCARLHNALVPWELAVLVLAFPFELSRGTDVRQLLVFLTKIFLILLLTAQAYAILNAGQLVVDQLLDQTGLVRPETVAKVYLERLSATLGQPEVAHGSAWRLLLDGHLVEALIYTFLLLVSYVALAVITVVTFVQQAALLLCYAVCPVLFACLAVPPLAHLGAAHVQRVLAILCWPLGFAMAATLTDALINMALSDRLLAQGSHAFGFAAAVENLIVMGFVGCFDVVSTIAAPFFIHRMLVGHSFPSRALPTGLTTAVSVALPAMGNAVQRGIEFVSHRVSPAQGGADRTSSSPSPPPPPPALALPSTLPPSPPLKDPGLPKDSDPTGARELNQLLNDDSL